VKRSLKLLLAAVGAAIMLSCLSKQMGGDGRDFQAYYKAAGRWLAGTSPYVYERDYSYKYPPVIVLPFTFFHLFSYGVARWVYAAMHGLLALILPVMLYAALVRDETLRLRARRNEYALGLLVAFAGSARFVDGEFQVSQVGLWIMGALLSGFLLIQRYGDRPWGRAAGLALMSLAALVKFHSSALFLSFARLKSWKTWAWVAGVFTVVALLPDPRMWADWAEQIRATTYDLPIKRSSVNLQGFYPLAVRRLGMNQFGPAPLLLALPLYLVAFLWLPRFSLRDVQAKAAPILLGICVWMLLGFMASPLPWQYTYSVLWVMMPLSWIVGTRRERGFLVAVALLLALTPQLLLGRKLAMWLEMHHSVFALVLAFWSLMLFQAKRRASDPAK
jgi:hypothetical protein